jgi:hypothetical protein
MNTQLTARALACASLLCLSPALAFAHVVAGDRIFPVTLTFDDPGVSDEASLPAFTYQRGGADGGTGPSHNFDFGYEFDKTITPNTALILNGGYTLSQINGSKTQAGFDNLVITGKWQAYTNAAHEFVVSLGIQREIGGTGTLHTGGDAYGSTSPTGYFGKGLGDLPIGALRPLAVTGELSYTIADKALKTVSTGDMVTQNNGSNNAWSGAMSLQYSIPYLQTQVKDYGLPSFIGNLVPIVEVAWSSPASSPSSQGTTWTVAPGVIYMAQWGEVGLEALIPGNKTTGTNVGAVALVHFFFDDLFPNSIGKPLFP